MMLATLTDDLAKFRETMGYCGSKQLKVIEVIILTKFKMIIKWGNIRSLMEFTIAVKRRRIPAVNSCGIIML